MVSKTILQCLKTKIFGLLYRKVRDPSLFVYIDADWASDQDNRRSMSRMVSLLNTGLITYKAQQETVPALSTTEAKYDAVTNRYSLAKDVD